MAYEFVSVHEHLPDKTFYAIQAIMATGFVLAVTHAVRDRRRTGNPAAVITLAGCFVYGLVVDITAYYTTDSFRHGNFTVMFLNDRLPLYIALFYPAFMYPVVMTMRRFQLTPIVEAVGTGFYAAVTYLIFDNIGPLLHWWDWKPTNSFNKPFIDSVPLNSYQWFFLFTIAFAYVVRRVVWDRTRAWTPRSMTMTLAAIPVLTYVGGAVLFIPADILLALEAYTANAVLYAIALAAAGYVLLIRRGPVRAEADPVLMLFPLIWVIGLLLIYAATWHLWRKALVDDVAGRPSGNLFAVAAGMAISVAITCTAHPRSESAP